MPLRSSLFKKEFIALAVLLLVLGLAVLTYALYDRPIDQAVVIPPAGAVVIRGTMVCMPRRDSRGPQTLECAYGLQDEAGRYYGLQDTDPRYSNISRVPMNTRVDVAGTFTPKEDMKYQSIGLIEVIRITPATSPSGIRGTVLVGPTCPVERTPPDPNCADRSGAIDLMVTTLNGDRTIETFRSNANGMFSLDVPPGIYLIRGASKNALPSCGATKVTVRADQYTEIDISCDSGIR